MAPGNSAEVATALLPGRCRAVVVNGAKAPTASTWPATNAAAAASVVSGRAGCRPSVRPAFGQREQQQVVVDGALLDGDLLALEVGDAGDPVAGDDLVVARGVVVDQDDRLLRRRR